MYDYEDQSGEVVLQVVRYEGKQFRQRRPNGSGGYIWNAKGVPPLLYRLPEIIEALSQDKQIFMVEGEKDADALRDRGINATTNPGGAGSLSGGHAEHLKGGDVIILPDNDRAGHQHAESVAEELVKAGARVRTVNLPGLGRKEDVSDWLEKGGTVEQLNELVTQASDWRPPQQSVFRVCWWGDEDSFPQRKWLIKDFLAQGELSFLYAPSGGGKSFFALHIGACISHGIDWFGHRVSDGPVVYVAAEGASGFVRRMKAWRQAHCLERRVPFALTPKVLNLRSNKTDADNLINHVEQISRICGQPVKLIVIDMLSRMLGGGTDADPRDIAEFLTLIEKVREESGAHVMVVHHTGKEIQRGMRGSSTLRDCADTAIEITKDTEGDLFTAKIEKQKDGEEGKAYTFRLAKSVLGQDEDGDEITSCVVEPVDASAVDNRSEPELKRCEKIALDALKLELAETGRPSPGGGIHQDVIVVDTEDWRERAYRSGISRSDQEAALRQAFHRSRQGLLEKGFICTQDTSVWLA